MAEAGTFQYTVVMHFANQQVAFRTSDVLELYFIEDIMSISVMGRAQIIDVQGAIERIESFTGDIPLSITFYKRDPETGNRSEEQSKLFYIYKLSGLTIDVTRKAKIYQILFADISYIFFNKMHFSYSWGDKDIKPETIVDDLGTKLAKLPPTMYTKDKGEPCKTKFQTYVSPFGNIRQNLQYIIPRIRSEEKDVAGYCFYVASDGKDNYKINFVTLEKLLSETGDIPAHNKLDFYQASKPRPGAELDECRVASWQVLSFDNANFDSIAGATFFGYDPEKGKEPFKCTFDYEMALEKTTILGATSLFQQAERVEVPADATGMSLEGDIDPAKPIKGYMDRDPETLENMGYDDGVKRYCQAQMLEVVTLGSSKRQIGTLAEMLIPAHFKWEHGAGNGDEGSYGEVPLEFHPRWSGKALIKSITHYFQAAEPMYLQKVVLMKNGYEKAIDSKGILAPAKKSNLGSGK